MDRETYIKKRQELVSKYPRVMSPGFMRGVRIGLGLISIFVVKLVSGSLPFYRNKCLYDNILEGFQPFQKNFQNKSSVIAIETLILLIGNWYNSP
jgi:hypothetical protein